MMWLTVDCVRSAVSHKTDNDASNATLIKAEYGENLGNYVEGDGGFDGALSHRESLENASCGLREFPTGINIVPEFLESA